MPKIFTLFHRQWFVLGSEFESGFLFDEDEDPECLQEDHEDTSDIKVPAKSDVTELKSLFSYEFESANQEASSSDNNISQDNLEYLHWKRVYYIEKFKIQNPNM